MIKKTYVQPTMKVVELDMADIVCQSGGSSEIIFSSNTNISLGDDQDSYFEGANVKRRNGIWEDE